jgi:acyl-coenzyme A synthetase/AMP-(fatty) acid ligase/acyl carrier protein
MNHMEWIVTVFGIEEADRVLQRTSIGFDASVWEIVAPLLAGGRLVLMKPDWRGDIAYLIEVIRRRAISILQVTPSILGLFLDAEGLETCQALRLVISGGEALPAKLARKFKQELPGVGLHNFYGPTETCIECTAFDCEEPFETRTVPIGRPVANTQVYVLDTHQQPVPVGVAGELYVGGAQVARGYLNSPELTAERFIPDPFRPGTGGLLYRTGDLTRYLKDGNIEYLGRLDHQVKLRGFRIELGEVEMALRSHPGVEDAVVVAREEEPGFQQLVGYVVLSEEAEVGWGELREHLSERLPEYMLPVGHVVLESLPLTPNGKVDRRALPKPDGSLTGPIENFVPPRNPMEATLAQIWADLLRLEQVGVHDNFFELGGHSLLATRVVSRIQQEFHVDLKLMHFFKMPTIAELAEGLEGLLWINAGRPSEAEAESQEREEGKV